MRTYPGINYDYRPDSYWGSGDPLQVILRNVNGENRRQMILDYAQQRRLEELDENLLKDELDEEARTRLGQIHPSFMGGDYLPGYLPGDVEIARICLQSTTSDAISLRAAPTARGAIGYCVVDEYDEAFVLPIPESDQPLTLAELIRQLDEGDMENDAVAEGGLSLGWNNSNADDGDRERLRHFTSISSEFYPQLEEHYERVFDDRVAESRIRSYRTCVERHPLREWTHGKEIWKFRQTRRNEGISKCCCPARLRSWRHRDCVG